MSPSLPILPFTRPPDGTVSLPGSKSLTNRALVLAALCDGPVRLEGALFSRDTRLMVGALRALGFAIEADEPAATITLVGTGGRIPAAEATLDVGNAGTVARFLTAFLCLREGGRYRLDGDAAVRRRPMRGLLDALVALGASIDYHGEPGCFPFTLRTVGLAGGEVAVDASESSQLLSALLLVGPAARAPLAVRLAGPTVSEPFVALTLAQLRAFGQPVRAPDADGVHRLPCGHPYVAPGGTCRVEPDATAASYFLALPLAAGGRVALPGLPGRPIQGDAAFADLLPGLGLAVERGPSGWVSRRAAPPPEGPRAFDFNAISDTFLTLAALAPLLPGETRITGIAHTRKQETDRVAAMATELRKLGQDVEETPDGDGLVVRPRLAALHALALAARREGRRLSVHTYEDHRVAMSFGVLGSHDLLGDGKPWLEIEDPACCGKTFPGFFAELASLRPPFLVIAIDGGAASGKSSSARAVADRLHFLHVDTGAHYRAVTFLARRSGVDPADLPSVEAFLAGLAIDSEVSGHRALIRLGGYLPHERELRDAEVNRHVSAFAAIPAVRRFLKDYQRGTAATARARGFAGLVMEGRDIGTVIFPDADLKFYLEADPAVRAARRAADGESDTIARRDAIDSGRATAPLRRADDAAVIDTGTLTLDEVADRIVAAVAARHGR